MKYINTDGRNYDQSQLNLLKTIDSGLVSAVKDAGTGQLKEAVQDLYKKMDPLARTPRQENSQQVKEAADWIKGLVKKGEPAFEVKAYTDYLETGQQGSGGYLIPELLETRIAHYVEQYGFARRFMRYMPFGGAGNTRTIPTEATGVSVSWVDEAGLKPISNITLGVVQQELKKLACISVMTEELIEDSAVNLIEYLARRIGDAIAKEEDTAFFTDTGVTWTGILHAAGTIPVSMGVGQTMANITPDSLLSMIFALPRHARTGGAFFFNSDAMELLMKYRADAVTANDGKGSYIMTGPTGSEPATFWGYPIYTLDVLPDSSDITDPDEPFGIFSNLSTTCYYGDKSGMRIKILSEATLTDSEGNTFSLAQRDAQALRVFKRVGYVPVLPSGIAVLHSGPVS